MNQQHPLYIQDRAELTRALQTPEPGPHELAAIARLKIRYDDFPGNPDIAGDIADWLSARAMDAAELNAKVREIWQSGWRPGVAAASDVGSGADIET
ncbi:MAG: DUF3288 family protein [Synechococcaceae cyanobacterium]|nr:DUF3288 family protein [Synechococcaceae cyanobacterium]